MNAAVAADIGPGMQRWWGCAVAVAVIACTERSPIVPVDPDASADPDAAPPPDAAPATPLHPDPAFDGDGALRLPDGVTGALSADGASLEVCGVTTHAAGAAVHVDALYTRRIAPGRPELVATWPMPAGWTAPARCVATALQPDDTAVAGFDLGAGTAPTVLYRQADGTFATPTRSPVAAPLRDVVGLPNGVTYLVFDDVIHALAVDWSGELASADTNPARGTFAAAAPIRAVARDPRLDPTFGVMIDVVTTETASRMWSPLDARFSGLPDFQFGYEGSIALPAFDGAGLVPLPDHGMLIVGDGAGLRVSTTGTITPVTLPPGRPARAVGDGADGAYLITVPAAYGAEVTITHVAPTAAGDWRVIDAVPVAPPDLCHYDPAAGCVDWLTLRDAVWTPDDRLALLLERRTGDAADATAPRFPQLLVLTR